MCSFVYVFYQYAQSSTIMAVQIADSEFAEFSGMQRNDSLMADNNLTLLCNNVAVPKDIISNTYILSQNMNTSNWQGSLSLNSSDYCLYFADDMFFSDKSLSLQTGHPFTLYVTNKSEYQILTIIFTGLPLINITTEKAIEQNFTVDDVDNYYFNSETRYYGGISIFNTASNTERFNVLSTGVCYHERGATSAIFEKKNYSLKLLEKDGSKDRQPLLGMNTSGEWKLVSMYTDKSKVRDMTCLQLWEEIASGESAFNEHGAQMSYCEVVLDGKLLGLYVF